MKKIALFLIIALFASELSFGQFALGLRVGYSGNKLTTNIDSIKSQFNNGFHVGVWARLGKKLYFAPEFLYNMSGGVFTSEGNVSAKDWQQKIKIGSIDIPLLVGYKIIHTDILTWRIELGPEGSFAVNKKISEMNSVTGPVTTSNIQTANWYILAGTGIDVLFLRLDVRYQYGLNEMIKDVQDYSLNSKNSMFVVSVGFKIFGGK